MKYSIEHSTRYSYASPVSDSFNDAHLCPVSDDLQKCLSFELEIIPKVASVLRRLDFYTNQVHHFEVLEPHELLEVVALSEVETFTDTRDFSLQADFDSLAGLGADERYYDFLSASAHVELTPMIEHEAKEIVDLSASVTRAVEQVMAFIFENFEYSPGATQVESTVAEVFAHKSGVCQDFAHLMIAFCRVVGIPARYVSGYFYVETPLSGTASDNTASHAWVECYLPGIGWVGYDPTHNRRVCERYIKLAVGRDYADVRPLAGTFRGEALADMEVSVTVQALP